MKIKDFTGKVSKILPVINGNNITDEILNNVLEIYISNELKVVLNSQLTKYNKIFNPKNKPSENLNLLRGTYIIGPYSSGKSHVALFLSLLLGLDVKFQDTDRYNEIPDIRKRCWDILEEIFSFSEMKEFNNLKEGNFIILNITLTDYLTQNQLEKIIIRAFNECSAAKDAKVHLGLTLTGKNTRKLLKLINDEPDEFNEYNNCKSKEEKNEFLIKYAEKNDFQIKHKSFGDFADDLQEFLNENNYNGIFIFLDEFYRYFIEKSNKDKMHIGSILQAMAHDIQSKIKLALLPITQVEMTSNDAFLRQVNRRFDRFPISYRNAEKLIHKRLIPHFEEKNLDLAFPQRVLNQLSDKTPDFSFSTLEKVYPFSLQTIDSLLDEVGKYSNNTKGVLSYCYTALVQNANNFSYELITTDTLFDYFIANLESPELEGYERWQNYQNINRVYISKLTDTSKKEITRKILKTLLFATSRATTWSRSDFQSHFYLEKTDDIDDCLDNLIKYIQEESNNCISTDIKNENFYYNPGVKQDLNKFIRIIENALIDEEVKNQFWLENLSKNALDATFYITPRELFQKAFNIKYISKKSDLNREIDETISKLDLNIDEDEIVLYEFDDEIIDAVFLIDPFNSSEQEIEKIVRNKFLSEENNSSRTNLKLSFYYLIPTPIPSYDLNKIRNFYSRKILLKILNGLKTKKMDWNEFRSQIPRGLINETEMTQRFNIFKSENNETLTSFAQTLKLSLESGENDLSDKTLINTTNIQTLRANLLKHGRIFHNLRWNTYNYDDFEENIENLAESTVFRKYSFLNNDIFKKTRKFHGRGFFNWFQDYVSLIVTDNSSFTLSNDLKPIAVSTFSPIGIFKLENNNSARFNTNINLEYPIFQNFKNIIDSDQKSIQISKILKEYMIPPFGFPKSFTLSIILYFLKLNIFQLSLESRSYSISKFLVIKGRNKNKQLSVKLNELVQDGIISIPEILSNEIFLRIKDFIKLISSQKKLLDEDFYELCSKINQRTISTIDNQKNLIKIFENKSIILRLEHIKKKMMENYQNLHSWVSNKEEYDQNSVENTLDEVLFTLKNYQNLNLKKWISDIFDIKNKTEYENLSETQILEKIADIIEKPLGNLSKKIFVMHFKKKYGSISHVYDLLKINKKTEKSLIDSFNIQFKRALIFRKIIQNSNPIYYKSNSDYDKIIVKILQNPINYINLIADPEYNLNKSFIELRLFNNSFIKIVKTMHNTYYEILSKSVSQEFNLEDSDNDLYLNFINHIRFINNQKRMKMDQIINQTKCAKITFIASSNGLHCKNCQFRFPTKFNFEIMGLTEDLFSQLKFNEKYEIKDSIQLVSEFQTKLQATKNNLIELQMKVLIQKYFTLENSLKSKLLDIYLPDLKDIKIDFSEILKIMKHNDFDIELISENKKIQKMKDKINDKLITIIIFIAIIEEYIEKTDFDFRRRHLLKFEKFLTKSKNIEIYISEVQNKTLTPIERIIREFKLIKLKELIQLEFQNNIHESIKKIIQRNFKTIMQEDSETFLIFPNQIDDLDNIINRFNENNLKFEYYEMKTQKNLHIYKKMENLFYEWDQIGYNYPDLRKFMEHMIRRMFSNCFFIGDKKRSNKIYDNYLKGKKLIIFEENGFNIKRIGKIWLKYGQKRVKFY